ncbi:MAG: hypothetical protein ACE5FK_00305 [Candidatus Methylomirabilia bacterium]
MNEPTLDTLTQRLDRVERQNRRMQIMGAVLIIGIALLVLPRTKTIQTEELIVKDAAGNPRATLGVGENDVPFLRLLDKNGKIIWRAP